MNNRFLIIGLFFILLFPVKINAQQRLKIDSIFLSHLMHENLEQERLAYYKLIDFSAFESTNAVTDIVYLSAKFKDTLLIKNYILFAKDTNDLLSVFYGAMLLNLKAIYPQILNELIEKKISILRQKQLQELINILEDKLGNGHISDQFYFTNNRIKKLEKKSVLLATLFSIIIPGSGKYYLLQNSEGTGALMLNLMAGVPLIELIIQYGLISTGAILSAVVFIPIYIANIYGTAISKKILLRKLNTQLKNEVLEYCNYQLHHSY